VTRAKKVTRASNPGRAWQQLSTRGLISTKTNVSQANESQANRVSSQRVSSQRVSSKRVNRKRTVGCKVECCASACAEHTPQLIPRAPNLSCRVCACRVMSGRVVRVALVLIKGARMLIVRHAKGHMLFGAGARRQRKRVFEV
jgi:hypothetical protein